MIRIGILRIAWVGWFVLMLGTWGRAEDRAVRVEQGDVVVETRTFNPDHPPADMPSLNGNEAAVTRSNFSCSTQMRVVVRDEQKTSNGCTSTVVIERIEMKLGLRITIWLPSNADRKLIAHEKAHQRISERYYRDAGRIAQELASPFIGRTLHAAGRECDVAVDTAIKKAIGELGGLYMGAVEQPASRAQILFDEITKHGVNGVDENTAIEQAVERVEKELSKAKEAKR